MDEDNEIHNEYERVVVTAEATRAVRSASTAAGAIAVFDQPLSPGEITEAGPLWLFDNFATVMEMESRSPPFIAEIARAMGERYEPA